MTKRRRSSDHNKRYRPASSHRWVTLSQICQEIDKTPAQTKKALRKLGYIGVKTITVDGYITKYDAASLEVIKALYGIPHREVMDQVDDWLSNFTANKPQPKEREND